MYTRRTIVSLGAMACASLLVPGVRGLALDNARRRFKTLSPRRALVLWYSQTGHTGRIGSLISHVWRLQGLEVDASDYRNFNTAMLGGYDLIAMGTPVFYMDVPENVRGYLQSWPKIEGTAVVSYTTFGGSGNNQHNTACRVLELLVEKGGVPAGIDMFGNMSTYAPTWSLGNAERTLRYRHLPNETTYDRVRAYARVVLDNVRIGRVLEIRREFDSGNILRHMPQIWGTKLMISTHRIDRDRCTRCGICQSLCPARAINVETSEVNHARCIACFGCVNNCPSRAIDMRFMGSLLTGFNEFLREHSIMIHEPAELRI